jgi:transposase
VIIGVDPHKLSATIEVVGPREQLLGAGRFTTDRAGYSAMRRYVSRFPERIWAIEGCSGIGRHVAHRLLAAGEEVVDLPPKLSARVRVFATGQGRKTNTTDAHSVALVGVRMAGLRPVVDDEQLGVLRLLVDRRRSLGEEHTRKVSPLHALLLELLSGGAKRDLSAAQAKRLIADVRPRDVVGKTCRRVAAELIADLERIYAPKKAADKVLPELVKATHTVLLDLHGIGPTGATRLLVEVRDLARFPDRNHFACWTGTAPIDASSGDHVRHRLCRGETDRSTESCTPWPPSSCATRPRVAATTTARRPPARPRWKPCAASNADCPTPSTEPCSMTSQRRRGRAREGNRATTLTPARPAHNPKTGSSDKPLQDPSGLTLRPPSPRGLDTEGSHERAPAAGRGWPAAG